MLVSTIYLANLCESLQLSVCRLEGNRQKKRVRQPHSTADRHRKKALNDGEYIMEEGRANYSVHFNIPDSVEYGEDEGGCSGSRVAFGRYRYRTVPTYI